MKLLYGLIALTLVHTTCSCRQVDQELCDSVADYYVQVRIVDAVTQELLGTIPGPVPAEPVYGDVGEEVTVQLVRLGEPLGAPTPPRGFEYPQGADESAGYWVFVIEVVRAQMSCDQIRDEGLFAELGPPPDEITVVGRARGGQGKVTVPLEPSFFVPCRPNLPRSDVAIVCDPEPTLDVADVQRAVLSVPPIQVPIP
jgi:hypothetical protein